MPALPTGTDPHNPNVIRASLGAYFTVPVVAAPTEEAIAWLRGQGIAIVATTPATETLYTAADLTGPVAVVMGSEAWGLSETWLGAADVRVRIPMAGQVDSLNLSAATALLLYEVVRQRQGAGEQGS
jgi:TrmH family RNA methyltransferase